MRVAPIALWLVSGCHALFGLDEVMLEQPIDGAVDTSIDARMRFGTPQRVAVTVPPGYYANDVTLTGDQQQMLFVTYDLATGNNPDVWVAEPPDSMAPALVFPGSRTPKISPDGLFLVLSTGNDLHAYDRIDSSALWANADSQLTGIPTGPTTDLERPGTITADLLQIVIYRRPSTGTPYVLYAYRRSTVAGAWSEDSSILSMIRQTHPAPSYSTFAPHLTADGLTLVYSANLHDPTQGHADLFLARRTKTDQPFDAPRLLEVNDPDLEDADAWLSPDGTTLWFARSHRNGVTNPSAWGIYKSTLEPF